VLAGVGDYALRAALWNILDKETAAVTRAAVGGGGGGKGGGGTVTGGGGGGDHEKRRQLRLSQLSSMTDEQFQDELRAHQAAKWGPLGLPEHYRRHGNDVATLLGYYLSETQYRDLSDGIRLNPERISTRITEDGNLEYDFTRSVEGKRAILLTTVRLALVRTLYPTPMSRWLRRYPEAVEVTDRA
jgi:hypothetical protein